MRNWRKRRERKREIERKGSDREKRVRLTKI